MATAKELEVRLRSMSDEDFSRVKAQLGDDLRVRPREWFVTAFKNGDRPEHFFCDLFGLETEAERHSLITQQMAQAALESAEASKKLAMIAERAQLDSQRSGW